MHGAMAMSRQCFWSLLRIVHEEMGQVVSGQPSSLARPSTLLIGLLLVIRGGQTVTRYICSGYAKCKRSSFECVVLHDV